MAREYQTSIDLNGNQLLNAVIQVLASDPGSPVEGQIWFNSTDNLLRYYDGTATINLGAGASIDWGEVGDIIASAVGDTASAGTLDEAARADHRHAREAFGAVTAETTFGISSANGSAATVARSDHTHGTPTHDDAAHSTVELNDLAAPDADVSFGGFKITNLANGSASTDAATVGQVNAAAAGLAPKDAVRVATTANGTLASAFENGDTIDGVALATGDRILLKNQTAGEENGIYTVAASGAPTRATDFDSSDDMRGAIIPVEAGTANANTVWLLTTDAPITVGTTSLSFSALTSLDSLVAGAGLVKTANTLDVGAGTGITVNANDVALDTAVAVRKFAADCDAATSTVVTHNLGTRDVTVSVVRTTTPWDHVVCDVESTSTNTVTVRFAVAPSAAEYRIVVHG